MRGMLTIVVFAVLAGCVPCSDRPLTDPDKDTMDLSVVGSWYWQEDDETGFVHIGLDEQSRRVRVVMLDLDKNGELDISEFLGHTSVLDDNRYLNLKWVRPKHEESGYLFVKYRFRDGCLGVSIWETETVEKAVKSGRLNGQISQDDVFFSVRVTEGQESLRRYVLEHDKALFKEMKFLNSLKLDGGMPKKIALSPTGNDTLKTNNPWASLR